MANLSLDVLREALGCPICHEVLFRPVINPCGHWTCHLCSHLAMKPDSASTCCLCRREYCHFAAVCAQMSQTLAKLFPEDTQRLAKERDAGVTRMYSADEPASVTHQDAGAAHEAASLSVSQFSCGACKRLLVHPVALNCGCLCCLHCAYPELDRSSTAASGATPVPRCVVCGARNVAPPEVCTPLAELFSKAFPQQTAQRLAELAEQAPRPAPPGPEDLHRDQPRQHHEEARGGGEEAGTSGEGASTAPPNLSRQVHNGVGCDLCGLYPIRGARFQCADCPQEIGFDLCGQCNQDVAAMGASVRGRFNQLHDPSHKMRKVGGALYLMPQDMAMMDQVARRVQAGQRPGEEELRSMLRQVLDEDDHDVVYRLFAQTTFPDHSEDGGNSSDEDENGDDEEDVVAGDGDGAGEDDGMDETVEDWIP
mmetsp:Transcript_28607/g.54704  ORF Transcript_28607/g.54704 Transcript_28607/m.54704 type:complete len:424 (-) Transcript_28607:398-1669(-)